MRSALLALCLPGALGGSVVMQGSQFALKLPQTLNIGERSAALLDVAVEAGVPLPEAAANSSLTLSLDKDHRLRLHSGPERAWVPLAWSEYKNTVASNGWGYLSVRASEDAKVSEELRMYAAGYLEGFSTGRQIRDFQHNADGLITKDEGDHSAMGNIKDMFTKRIQTIAKRSNIHANGTVLSAENAPKDNWWRHARLMLLQGWGILDAYNLHAESMKGLPMSLVDLVILNSDGETPELEMAYDFNEVALREANRNDPDYNPDDDDTTTALIQERARLRRTRGGLRGALQPHEADRKLIAAARSRRHEELRTITDAKWRKIKEQTGRCSALVRLASNNSELFVGHTTFSDYSEMNRIWKYYDLPLQGGATRKMGFSSYPGVAGSTDDYYIMDTGLVVTETTVSMLTDAPFDNLNDTAELIPDYMRIMLSNRLAHTAAEWVNYMTQSATGTYNSQWMVVDYNKFKPGEKLQNQTFWVLEQAPGVSKAEDMSQRLQQTGFWASENRAHFSAIRNISGETEAQDTMANLFSENHNPRANIFAKTEVSVNLLEDMRQEMQRNEWPHEVDGGPSNTPDHAIASRGDLARSDPSPNGGVDSKITSSCLAKRLAADAIAGPTHQGQKPFKWTDDSGKSLYPDYPRDGLPDVWNFDWVRMTPFGEAAATKDCK